MKFFQYSGMTQIDQDRIILQLRNGDLDGIVSTSVGEEGIDIPDCNLILRYDHVGNEISTVQTKGTNPVHCVGGRVFDSSLVRQDSDHRNLLKKII